METISVHICEKGVLYLKRNIVAEIAVIIGSVVSVSDDCKIQQAAALRKTVGGHGSFYKDSNT